MTMVSKERALLLWVDENMTGIEDVKIIPEESRFEGCIAPVVWRGDKQVYPAKVLKISDNISELEDLEATILLTLPQNNSKRKKETAKPARGMASDRDVSKALGERPPIPVSLLSTNTKVKTALKKSTKASRSAQAAIDSELLQKSSVQAPISQGKIVNRSKTKSNKPDSVLRNKDATEDGETDEEDHIRDADLLKQTGQELPAFSDVMTCCCQPCKKMALYANNCCRGLLRTILDLLSDESKGAQYLKLLEIDPGESVVELTKNSAIFLPLATKNQIKVDCSGNPKKMVKETLFALYGEDAFKHCNVTAKGRKGFGIDPKVLSATLSFVNRNNKTEDKLKSSEVVTYINKRMADWRSPPKSSTVITRKLYVPSTPTSSRNEPEVVINLENEEIHARTPTPEKRTSPKSRLVKPGSATAAGGISTQHYSPSKNWPTSTPQSHYSPFKNWPAQTPHSPFKNWPAPPAAVPAQPGSNPYTSNYTPFQHQAQAPYFPYQPYGYPYNHWSTDQQGESAVPGSTAQFQYHHQMTTAPVNPPKPFP